MTETADIEIQSNVCADLGRPDAEVHLLKELR
jgi:hypothetical protein